MTNTESSTYPERPAWLTDQEISARAAEIRHLLEDSFGERESHYLMLFTRVENHLQIKSLWEKMPDEEAAAYTPAFESIVPDAIRRYVISSSTEPGMNDRTLWSRRIQHRARLDIYRGIEANLQYEIDKFLSGFRAKASEHDLRGLLGRKGLLEEIDAFVRLNPDITRTVTEETNKAYLKLPAGIRSAGAAEHIREVMQDTFFSAYSDMIVSRAIERYMEKNNPGGKNVEEICEVLKPLINAEIAGHLRFKRAAQSRQTMR